jgi:hypothetical protein
MTAWQFLVELGRQNRICFNLNRIARCYPAAGRRSSAVAWGAWRPNSQSGRAPRSSLLLGKHEVVLRNHVGDEFIDYTKIAPEGASRLTLISFSIPSAASQRIVS